MSLSPPPKQSSFGNALIRWEEIAPGIALIQSQGDSQETRHLAHLLLASELETLGYLVNQLEIPGEFTQITPLHIAHIKPRFGSWNDVQQKAIRLVKNGQVQLLRNGYQYVVARVQGDHGVYTVEFSRQDPGSRVLTQKHCTCLIPGSKIVLADGTVKNIEDVKVDDLVLTASGRPGRVNKTFVLEYNGPIYGVKISGSNEVVWMTEDHKLFTPEGTYLQIQNWTDEFTYMPQMQVDHSFSSLRVLDYIEQGNLEECDDLLYKKNKGVGKPRPIYKTSPVQYAVIPKYSKAQTPFPAQIKLNAAFARLAGLYLAEGLVTSKGEIRWCLGLHEEILAEELVALLLQEYGVKAHIEVRPKKSNCIVALSSQPLAALFKTLFGTGSKEKRIHKDIFSLPLDILEVFFQAWCEGDGHTTKDGREGLATSSYNLAMQARLILSLLERESIILRKDNNKSKLVPNGTTLYKVSWRTQKNKGNGSRYFEKGKVYQKTEILPCIYYNGIVHNFSVVDAGETGYDEHTYLIYPGIASKNCPWFQYNWGTSRDRKKFEGRVCSHVLAAYYTSKKAPLDEDIHPATQYGQQPQQQAFPEQQPGVATYPDVDPLSERYLHQDDPWQGADPLPEDLGTINTQPSQSPPFISPSQNLIPMQQQDFSDLAKDWLNELNSQPISVISPQGPYPGNPLQQMNTLSKKTSNYQFQNGDTVRLNVDTKGQTEGREGAIDAGQWVDIPRNSMGTVVDFDPTTNFLMAIFPLTGGAMTSYHAKTYLSADEVSLINRQPRADPFTQRT